MVVGRLRRCGYLGRGCAVLAWCWLLPGCPLADDYYIDESSTETGTGGTITAGGGTGTGDTLTPGEGMGAGGTYTAGGAMGAGGTYTTGGVLSAGGTLTAEGGMATGGTHAAGGQAGLAGFAGVPVELAQGKSVTASSEETSRGNLALLGNDGNPSTRWSASDGTIPAWWRVDLGLTYRLSRVEIDWEFARRYGYRIEVSDDDLNYVTVVDRSNNVDAAQKQTVNLNTSARFVKITVTWLTPFPASWASFWEVRVYGW
jgi:hypothetical protein